MIKKCLDSQSTRQILTKYIIHKYKFINREYNKHKTIKYTSKCPSMLYISYTLRKYISKRHDYFILRLWVLSICKWMIAVKSLSKWFCDWQRLSPWPNFRQDPLSHGALSLNPVVVRILQVSLVRIFPPDMGISPYVIKFFILPLWCLMTLACL